MTSPILVNVRKIANEELKSDFNGGLTESDQMILELINHAVLQMATRYVQANGQSY